jgi:hypothetical protein
VNRATAAYRSVRAARGSAVGHLSDEHVFEQVFAVALDLAPDS